MSDTLKNINCPACGCEMTKVFIAEKSINVDVCDNGCGGIYFDNQEIQEFNEESADLSEIQNLTRGKNFPPVDNSKVRICPSCGTKMAKTFVFGVQIETCYNCGGLFLDNGVFEIVRSHFKKRPLKPVRHISAAKSQINLQEFYADSQKEKIMRENSEMFFSHLFFGRRRSLFGLLLRALFRI